MKLLIGVLAATIGLSNFAIAAELDLYSQANKIRIHSKAKLSKTLRSDLSNFKKKYKYYAAFIVNPEEDRGGWTSSHSLDHAINGSMKVCKSRSENKNACVVYATIIPKGYTPKKGTITLNQSLTKEYKTKFTQDLKDQNYGAIASYPFGGWGWATASTKKQAEKDALKWCNVQSVEDKAYLPETWEKVITKDEHKCRIYISQKGGL